MKQVLKLTLFLIMTSLILWCAGFLWFATVAMPAEQATATQAQADAIVVLTGDRGRIEEGFYLFSTHRAPRLYISGVNRSVALQDLTGKWDGAPLPDCCIDMGYEAANTWGNAQESAEWFKKHHISSIFLVTSDYHMPRARVEFHFAAPEVTVYPHPVFSEPETRRKFEFTKLMVGEYHKTILTYIRNVLSLGDL
ncbi:MAG: YdcF family protein [Rhodospirillales bacterium]|nr:YdcF family protein [Rhodospirillales bacterium]MCB9973585.1 YdcF family protein [Rhodospirillales bacterium]MCB9979611.1 YdcF family protein [Rhodospirillales bacterium]